jgi:hypothetical protein
MKRTIFIINIFLLTLVIAGLISCVKKTEKIKRENLRSMDFLNFQEKHSGLANFFKNNDSLFITVEFSDCGEWGGHKEILIIYKNSENKLVGQLKIDSIPCENIKDYEEFSDLDDNYRKIVKSLMKDLSVDDERLVNLFIHRILELKLNFNFTVIMEGNEEIIPIYADAGTVIEIRNSDSSFMIEYYNMDESANTWYGKIRKEIFGLKI